jgi:hypothetical protein
VAAEVMFGVFPLLHDGALEETFGAWHGKQRGNARAVGAAFSLKSMSGQARGRDLSSKGSSPKRA